MKKFGLPAEMLSPISSPTRQYLAARSTRTINWRPLKGAEELAKHSGGIKGDSDDDLHTGR